MPQGKPYKASAIVCDNMNDPEDLIREVMKTTGSALQIENIMMESFRDLLKDQIKEKMRETLEKNPEIKKEIGEAVETLIEARLKEAYALIKLAKASSKLGLEVAPSGIRDDMIKSFTSLFENELMELMKRF